MARILLTAVTADIRGKLGGSVFKESGSGLVLQTKAGGRKKAPRSGQDTRQPMREISQTWKGLPEADRAGWMVLAAATPFPGDFGAIRYLSGHMLYQRAMWNQFEATGFISPLRPNGWNPPIFAISLLVANASPNSMQIGWNDYGSAKDRTVILYGTDSFSSSIMAWHNKLRFIRATQITSANIMTFTADYNAVWRRVLIGSRVGFRMKMIDNVTFADSHSEYIDAVVTF